MITPGAKSRGNRLLAQIPSPFLLSHFMIFMMLISLYLLKTSENLRLSDNIRGYRKRLVAWNGFWVACLLSFRYVFKTTRSTIHGPYTHQPCYAAYGRVHQRSPYPIPRFHKTSPLKYRCSLIRVSSLKSPIHQHCKGWGS